MAVALPMAAADHDVEMRIDFGKPDGAFAGIVIKAQANIIVGKSHLPRPGENPSRRPAQLSATENACGFKPDLRSCVFGIPACKELFCQLNQLSAGDAW